MHLNICQVSPDHTDHLADLLNRIPSASYKVQALQSQKNEMKYKTNFWKSRSPFGFVPLAIDSMAAVACHDSQSKTKFMRTVLCDLIPHHYQSCPCFLVNCRDRSRRIPKEPLFTIIVVVSRPCLLHTRIKLHPLCAFGPNTKRQQYLNGEVQ